LLENGATFTVPNGFIARISNFISNSSLLTDDNWKIRINAQDVYIASSMSRGANQTDQAVIDAQFSFKGEIYIPSGDVITNIDAKIAYISIQLIPSNILPAILVTSSVTVPTGKKWKISAMLCSNPRQSTYSILINGITCIIGNVTQGVAANNGKDRYSFSLLNNEIWLPEGTVLSPSTNIYGLSVLEY
jgi:hypothetical protein